MLNPQKEGTRCKLYLQIFIFNVFHVSYGDNLLFLYWENSFHWKWQDSIPKYDQNHIFVIRKEKNCLQNYLRKERILTWLLPGKEIILALSLVWHWPSTGDQCLQNRCTSVTTTGCFRKVSERTMMINIYRFKIGRNYKSPMFMT